MSRLKGLSLYAILALLPVVAFQNCAKPGISIEESGQTLGSGIESCKGDSCPLDPLTDKATVTTILLALGDRTKDQLVIPDSSSQTIAETLIRYSTPVNNPKILIVLDSNSRDEDLEDVDFLENVLLHRYNCNTIKEPSEGLKDSDVAGYDLVWVNNPGWPLGTKQTRDTLIRFKGGVILQGDDMSKGENFSVTELTGLIHKDNGTQVICNGKSYPHDDNNGYQYTVTLNANSFPSQGT